MRIEDLRHNFTVYILADTVDQGIECRNHLAQHGYDAFQFSDERPLLAEMERSLPHVLVFSMNSMFGDLKSFVEMLAKTEPNARNYAFYDREFKKNVVLDFVGVSGKSYKLQKVFERE